MIISHKPKPLVYSDIIFSLFFAFYLLTDTILCLLRGVERITTTQRILLFGSLNFDLDISIRKYAKTAVWIIKIGIINKIIPLKNPASIYCSM
jgi:hypothetical protein